MGNANSTLSGEIEDRDPTSSPSLSRHSSRTGPRPSHNHAYGQGAPPSSYTYLAASGAVAGGSTTPVSLSRKSSIDSESHQAAGLHRPSTSHSPPRSRSRSSSLQGFWTRNKANTTQQQLDHAHGEPNVSSLLRREPVNAPAEFSGAGTSPSTGTGEESAASLAQRRRRNTGSASASPAASPAVGLHLSIPGGIGGSGVTLPPGVGGTPAHLGVTGPGRLTSPLSSPLVGTDSMHAHGFVSSGVGGEQHAQQQWPGYHEGASGASGSGFSTGSMAPPAPSTIAAATATESTTPSAAVSRNGSVASAVSAGDSGTSAAAAVAAAVAKSRAQTQQQHQSAVRHPHSSDHHSYVHHHAHHRNSAVFSTDVGEISAYGIDEDEFDAAVVGAGAGHSSSSAARRAGSAGHHLLGQAHGHDHPQGRRPRTVSTTSSVASSGVASALDAERTRTDSTSSSLGVPGGGGNDHLGGGDDESIGPSGGKDAVGRSLARALPSYLKIPTAIPSENVPPPTVDGFTSWRSSSPPTNSALGPGPGPVPGVMMPGTSGGGGSIAAEYAKRTSAARAAVQQHQRQLERGEEPDAEDIPGLVPLAGTSRRPSRSSTPSATVSMLPHLVTYGDPSSSSSSAAYGAQQSHGSADADLAVHDRTDLIPTMLASDSVGRYVPTSTAVLGAPGPLLGASSAVRSYSGDEVEGAPSRDQSRSPPLPIQQTKLERDGSRTPTPTPGSRPSALTPRDSNESAVGIGAGPEPGTPTGLVSGTVGNGKGSAATLKGHAVGGMTPAQSTQPASEQQPQQSRKSRSSASAAVGPGYSPTQARQRPVHVPLMPIVITWKAGGREVFVTGTFANEWRSKIPLRRAKRDHTCILHLPPGTHRLKFIVDDRWRVSKDLPTASDGDGNLVNYVEIPNVGPAHPGPLSAPGEDLLGDPTVVAASSAAAAAAAATGGAGAGISSATGRIAGGGEKRGKTVLDSHKSTMDLQEEARRAEILRRGDLDDVFADSEKQRSETWTREIPLAIVKAQEAEEAAAVHAADEEQGAQPQAQQTVNGVPANLPIPPTLPRQLEKVILNSSQAGNAVDDNSVLPAPNHVVLNHLTASAIKGGVLAVGTTTRYKRKYVTTVFYRPVKT